MDSSCAIIALDRGAADILQYHRDGSRRTETAYLIDRNILQAVHNARTIDSSGLQRVRVGSGDFTCRTYQLEGQDASLKESIGVLLERQWDVHDAVAEIGAQYKLTKREEQALRGLSLGLTTQALASKMNVRQSTLRAFLRLIRIKMGVTTRAGIIAKILERMQS